MTRTAILQLFRDGKLIDSVAVSEADTPIVIGRDARAHVCLDQERVSRQHARIDFDGAELSLNDLTSTNGTLLNDVPVECEPLRNGDVIGIGDFLIAVTVPQSSASDRSVDAEMDVVDTIQVSGQESGERRDP